MKRLYTSDKRVFGEIKYTQKLFDDYKMHWHSALSLSFVASGSLKVHFKESTPLLSTNAIAIFNPYEAHRIQNIDAQGYYVLFISRAWSVEIQEELFSTSQNADYLPLSSHTLVNAKILPICQEILNAKESQVATQKLISLLKKLFLEHCTKDKVQESQIVQKIKSYITKHIDEKIDLESLAKSLSYNKSHISRVFKKELGLSIREYISSYKIDSFKEELYRVKHKTNLLNLAIEKGFYDQSHCNRNFKKVFGSSPAFYVKK